MSYLKSNIIALFSCVLLVAATAAGQGVQLITINSNGTASGTPPPDATIGHYGGSISADGRFVSFSSSDNDLVTNDTNGFLGDGFVRDTQSGTTMLVSVNRFGTGSGNGRSGTSGISADGRYVLIASTATDLVATPTLGGDISNVFVRDLQTNTTTLVTVNVDGTGGANGGSNVRAFSANGRVVVFESGASNLVASGRGGMFARDLETGKTHLLGVSTNGQAATSADGRIIVFESFANNLVPNDANNATDIFAYDLATEILTLVSVNRAGTSSANTYNAQPSISSNGRYVSFESIAGDLTNDSVYGRNEVYVRDLLTNTTRLVSRSVTGEPTGYVSASGSAISGDGRIVIFKSSVNNLVPNDFNDRTDIFARNLETNTTSIVSGGNSGFPIGTALFYTPSISADGQRIAFYTESRDIYVRDLQAGKTVLASVTADGDSGNKPSVRPRISLDGTSVVFSSLATNLVANDTNGNSDLFLFRFGQSTTPSNAAPSVTLTSPVNGATFASAPAITLSADASDGDGSIAKVDFYAGTTLIGTATSEPYQVTWTPSANGEYRLSAVATDDKGAFTTTPAVKVRVGPPPAYSISGQVIEYRGGALSGVTVMLISTRTTGAVIATTTTDAGGNYSFSGVVADSYFVGASKTGYYFASVGFSVTTQNRKVDLVGIPQKRRFFMPRTRQ